MIRSAATRIALIGSAAFAAATVLLGAAVWWTVDHALRAQLDGRISAEMSSLISEYHGEGEKGLREVIARREIARATNDLGYGLFDQQGGRLAGALEVEHPATGWQTLTFSDPAENQRVSGRALAADVAPGRRLVVAADFNAVSRVDHLILALLGIALGATVAIGTLGAVLLATYLRRRLAVISGGAEAIVAGDLAQRIPVGPRHDEFDRLATVLNAMLDRITALLENLRRVSGDVAHDLRRPLTRLRNLLEQGLEAERQDHTLERAIVQVDEVLAIFASLLRLSEIEAGKLRLGFSPVALDLVAADLGEGYAPAIEDGGRTFQISVGDTPAIEGDRELLAQAISNLLDNAQIHTPPGTMIRLTALTMADHVVIAVDDDGPGIPEQDRARVVERFARLESSRSLPGHGLGLSLAEAIAAAHGARLVLRDNQPGLHAALEFPR